MLVRLSRRSPSGESASIKAGASRLLPTRHETLPGPENETISREINQKSYTTSEISIGHRYEMTLIDPLIDRAWLLSAVAISP